MSSISRIRQEASRWLNNGANLITLSRMPMLICVQWAALGVADLIPAQLTSWLMTLAIISTWSLVVVWSHWKCLLTASSALGIAWVQLRMPALGREELFLFLVVMQVIGMVTDGLDGRFARKYSKVGPTPEGQFLDQFIDKVFVWVTWFALMCLVAKTYSHIWQLILFGLGLVGSLYLALLDFRSCKKHWLNYLADRGKPLNKESGAKWQGKVKFCMENVVICAGLISFCPVITAYEQWYQFVLFPFVWVGKVSLWLTIPALVAAIVLARSSLRSRGVIKKG